MPLDTSSISYLINESQTLISYKLSMSLYQVFLDLVLVKNAKFNSVNESGTILLCQRNYADIILFRS